MRILNKYKYSLNFFIFLIFSCFYLYQNSFYQNFDEKLRDIYFEIRGPIKTTNQITIIDIDEKSLNNLGQWPFPRIYMAQVLANLTNAKVGIIGLDIIFAEPDRSSPSLFAKKLNINGDFQDYDLILSNVISKTPTILGYYFSTDSSKNNFSNIASKIDNKDLKDIYTYSNVVNNIDVISNNAYSSGFFNIYNNVNDKTYKVPLILAYKNKIYPSLSLEILSIANNTNEIKIHKEGGLINSIQLENINIPTDKNGFFRINYRGPAKTFKYLSFYDVLKGDFDKKDVEGKFILIGTSTTTLADLRATIYDLNMPGVEIHANFIDNVLKGDFFKEPPYAKIIDILSIFLLTVVLGYLYKRVNYVGTLFIFISILFSYTISMYLILFKYMLVLNLFFPLACIVLTTLISLVIKYINESKQKDFIKSMFAKKVSKDVVEDLVKDSDEELFKPRKKLLSIFFSDLRDFTKISEKLNNPALLVEVLNKYITPMTDIVIKNHGTIDKYIGDSIMAYYNAPKDLNNHCDFALNTAIEQIKVLKQINKDFEKMYNIKLEIGIGLHCGEVVVAEIGSNIRSDYTIIGDNVNVASRIESLNKYFQTNIIITKDIKDQLVNKYNIFYLCEIVVKGKTTPVKIYEVLDDEKYNLIKPYIDKYQQAISLFENKKIEESKKIFVDLEKNLNKKIISLYIDKCEKILSDSSHPYLFVMDFK